MKDHTGLFRMYHQVQQAALPPKQASELPRIDTLTVTVTSEHANDGDLKVVPIPLSREDVTAPDLAELALTGALEGAWLQSVDSPLPSPQASVRRVVPAGELSVESHAPVQAVKAVDLDDETTPTLVPVKKQTAEATPRASIATSTRSKRGKQIGLSPNVPARRPSSADIQRITASTSTARRPSAVALNLKPSVVRRDRSKSVSLTSGTAHKLAGSKSASPTSARSAVSGCSTLDSPRKMCVSSSEAGDDGMADDVARDASITASGAASRSKNLLTANDGHKRRASACPAPSTLILASSMTSQPSTSAANAASHLLLAPQSTTMTLFLPSPAAAKRRPSAAVNANTPTQAPGLQVAQSFAQAQEIVSSQDSVSVSAV